MTLKEHLQNGILLLDGGMGTLLQERGLCAGELPERRNITHARDIIEVHRAYYDAGANLVATNSFGANRLKYERDELSAVIFAAVANARRAAEESRGTQDKFVALDIGPLGRLLRPFGDMAFEDAVAVFRESIELGAAAGVDAILIETMNDLAETRAAVLAAKEATRLPILVSNAYGEDGKLLTGSSPETVAAVLTGMGVDAIGANCSQGPRALLPIIDRLLFATPLPVFFKPNAGLPTVQNGKTVFSLSPDDFARDTAEALRRGAAMAGGCCGTTPRHIEALRREAAGIERRARTVEERTICASYTEVFDIGKARPALIGERLNPTGKKRLKEALKSGDQDYLLRVALDEEREGADILDVNVGIPEVEETRVLPALVSALQGVTSLPLEIDTADPRAMEAALRIYHGRAILNSVSGKEESMRAVFPLARKYGGVVIALTLDEQGIPETAEGRLAIARRIAARAAEYGIPACDLIFDPLTLTASTDKNAPRVTLDALRLIRDELGCHTSLGVSNISFGLPNRDALNSVFFAMALESGLSAAIMNPASSDMKRVAYAHRALAGQDESFTRFIAFSEGVTAPPPAKNLEAMSLADAVIRGLPESASAAAAQLLETKAPLTVIEEDVIPALDEVGRGYEAGKLYLPRLLLAAEAAGAAFAVIQRALPAKSEGARGQIVLATVAGDIHDIGKNIVSLLLKNYGFSVLDLGRDVAPEAVLRAVKESRAALCGLSALMTTTLPAMRDTVSLLKRECPETRIVVGGAVLTKEYAHTIGADCYAKGAMDTVRYAESVFDPIK